MKLDLLLKFARPRRAGILYFILVVPLLLTEIATSYVAVTAKTKDRLRFENATVTLLRGTSGLFAASNNVACNDFRAYIDSLQLRNRYPGILGIGFSAKDALIADMRKQGVINFKITPDFQRSEYHSIVCLEPNLKTQSVKE